MLDETASTSTAHPALDILGAGVLVELHVDEGESEDVRGGGGL